MLNVKKTLTKILKNTPQIRTGAHSAGAVAANSYVDVPVLFSTAMKGTPIVLITLTSESDSPTMGSFSVSANSVSSTGFTARVFNNTSGGRSPGFRYVALYGGGA